MEQMATELIVSASNSDNTQPITDSNITHIETPEYFNKAEPILDIPSGTVLAVETTSPCPTAAAQTTDKHPGPGHRKTQGMSVLRQPYGPKSNYFNGMYKGRGKREEHVGEGGAEGEVVCCQKMRISINKHTHPIKAAKEIARCLHEFKQNLIINVVKTLGVEKSYELFLQTKAIQENGGEMTAEGSRKRDPGGVFLSLVKKTGSKEQVQEIFRDERQRSAYRKKMAKSRRNQKLATDSTKDGTGNKTCNGGLSVLASQSSAIALNSDGTITTTTQCNEDVQGGGGGGGGDGKEDGNSLVEDMEVDTIETQCNGHHGSLSEYEKLQEFEQMAIADVDFGIEFD